MKFDSEKRQKLLSINVRNVWKFTTKVRKFMKGDNTLLLQALQGLKIAARILRNSFFSPLITSELWTTSILFLFNLFPTTVISAWRPSARTLWHVIEVFLDEM